MTAQARHRDVTIGYVGDHHDDGLAEMINGLDKTELVRNPGSFSTAAAASGRTGA